MKRASEFTRQTIAIKTILFSSFILLYYPLFKGYLYKDTIYVYPENNKFKCHNKTLKQKLKQYIYINKSKIKMRHQSCVEK